MQDKKNTTRREFLKSTSISAVGLSAIGSTITARVLGANNRIRMGFIGVGNRGSQLLQRFMSFDDVEVAAICDTYEPYRLRDYTKVSERWKKELGGRIPKMGEQFNSKPKLYRDFRQLLDNKDIDAVCIATPDHWHALTTVMACKAGKDVYVEKPLTATIFEGRKMVEVAKRTKRVVQVGLNRRGSTIYQQLAKQVKEGLIGKVTVARAAHVSNMFPDGIGHAKAEAPPKGFDWDMWLGPRAQRPYQYNIAPYKFRWWKSYSSQMGNWGVHYMDAIRWLMGERAPVAITASGGKYVLKDDRTIPDTMEVTFEFASGAVVIFSVYEASGGRLISDGEVELRGTKANLSVDDSHYKIAPTKPGQFQDRGLLMEAKEFHLEKTEDITTNLIRNFLDCVKSRNEVWCPLEEGHRSTSFAHLANISLEMKMRLLWDADNEKFTNSAEANKFLHYEYRKPWELG